MDEGARPQHPSDSPDWGAGTKPLTEFQLTECGKARRCVVLLFSKLQLPAYLQQASN